MSNHEAAIEAEIQAKGLTAPRLTPEHIDAQIIGIDYIQQEQWPAVHHELQSEYVRRALKCLTVCVLVLRNGYTIVGKSACASPENFDVDLGCKIALEDARRQIWALEGYALRNKLAG